MMITHIKGWTNDYNSLARSFRLIKQREIATLTLRQSKVVDQTKNLSTEGYKKTGSIGVF